MVPGVSGSSGKALVTVVELRHLAVELVGKVVVGVGVNGQKGQTEVPDGRDTYWGSQFSFMWDAASVRGRVLIVELLREVDGSVLAECRLDLRRKWEDYKWCDFIAHDRRVGSICLECDTDTSAPSSHTRTVPEEVRWEHLDIPHPQTPRSDGGSSPIYTARTSTTVNNPPASLSPPIRAISRDASTPRQESFYKEQLNDVVAGLRHVYSTLPAGDAVLRRQIELLMAKAGAPLDTIPKTDDRREIKEKEKEPKRLLTKPVSKRSCSTRERSKSNPRSNTRNATPVRTLVPRSKRRTSSVGMPQRQLIPLREVAQVDGRGRRGTRSPLPTRDREKTPGPVLMKYVDRHQDPSASIGSTQSAPAFRRAANGVPALVRRYGAATPSDSISSTKTAPVHRSRVGCAPHSVSVNRTRPKPLPPPPSPISEVTELRLPSKPREPSEPPVTSIVLNPRARERDNLLAALLNNQTQSICCNESELSFEDLEELVGVAY
eukprot:TRINITY_DN1467_c0_g3_i1.p1 TRINITY_DN1467_c0_g3~~TRINITY_DN1467_c0_g3_i1.p1  ORF type:complete len:491 (+),score=95.54 TRINITY_DN1467_c0_g3_i1:47-1519(+)